MNDIRHGGKREGAGRPLLKSTKSKIITLRLNEQQAIKLVALGGTQWVREKIEKAEIE